MSKKAFTLIEMLVTITIISILAGFVVVKLNDSNNLAKDTQRKADINLLANSVVSYSSDHYSGKPVTDENGCTIGGGTDRCSTEIEDALKAYLPTLPSEPSSNSYYIYWSNGNDCTVTANLSSSNPDDAYVYSCTPDTASAGDAVNGACGSVIRAQDNGYASSISDWPSSNFCNAGTLHTSPVFPAQGGSTSWTCVGEYLGNNVTCTAYRALDGDCGTADYNTHVFADAETPFGTYTICDAGTPAPSPTPPAKGTSITWTCAGVNGGISPSCTARHSANGVCGTFNNTNSYAAPLINPALCNPGTAGTVTLASNNWTWTCAGLLGGVSSGTCTTHKKVDGVCGSANNKTYAYNISAYSPDAQCLAGTGTASNTAFPPLGGSTTWTCSGLNSGNPSVACTASRAPTPVNGVCGSNAQTYAYNVSAWPSATDIAFCATGTAPLTTPGFPAAGGSTNWTCAGSAGGTNASCSASRYAAAPIAGVCGSASQNCASIATTVAPTTNLCSKGTASAISGTGPWTWTCSGQYGGAASPTCVVYKADSTLYGNRHSAAQCTCMGGSVAAWGGQNFCKMSMNSCTGNWLWYGDLSESGGTPCWGSSGWVATNSYCQGTSCTTPAKAWGTGPTGTCTFTGANFPYFGSMDGAFCDYYGTCYGQHQLKGCY